MTDDVDEKQVVPFPAARGARFDSSHADVVASERLEQPIERTRRLRVTGREQQRRLVFSARREQLAADHEKTRRVVFGVFDLGHDDVETIHLRRSLTRDRGRAVLVARPTGRLCIAAYGNAFDARQMLVQPMPALSKGLLVRTDAQDFLEPVHASHQMLMNAQLDLAANLERRGDEHIERVVDRALGRILDRYDTEVRVSRLHLFEDFADRGQRQRAHRVPEVLQHRLLRERPLRPEECDFERLLLREAGGHDLAEQPYDLLVAQRPLIARDDVAQHLRLALGLVELDGAQLVRALLRYADLLCELRALVEERVDLLVDPIDVRANRAQVRSGRARLALRCCGALAGLCARLFS